MRDGYPSMDLWTVDIRRALPFQGDPEYLRERVTETLGRLYAVHWPFHQYRTARDIRKSPFYDRLAAQGACFGEAQGWERPNWYAPDGVKPETIYSFSRQNGFDYSAAEHRAVRENVGLFDQRPLSKFLLQRPGPQVGEPPRAGGRHVCTPLPQGQGDPGRAVLASHGLEQDPLARHQQIVHAARVGHVDQLLPPVHGDCRRESVEPYLKPPFHQVGA